MIQPSNDSDPDAIITRDWVLVALNVISAVISAYFAAVALFDPAANPGIRGAVTSAADFYAAMYAVRAIPLAIAVCWIAIAARGHNRHGLMAVLVVAGTVQACDLVIGLVSSTPSMVAGAAAATAIHLGSAVLIRRR